MAKKFVGDIYGVTKKTCDLAGGEMRKKVCTGGDILKALDVVKKQGKKAVQD